MILRDLYQVTDDNDEYIINVNCEDQLDTGEQEYYVVTWNGIAKDIPTRFLNMSVIMVKKTTDFSTHFEVDVE